MNNRCTTEYRPALNGKKYCSSWQAVCPRRSVLEATRLLILEVGLESRKTAIKLHRSAQLEKTQECNGAHYGLCQSKSDGNQWSSQLWKHLDYRSVLEVPIRSSSFPLNQDWNESWKWSGTLCACQDVSQWELIHENLVLVPLNENWSY
jgi:hypothetical protein